MAHQLFHPPQEFLRPAVVEAFCYAFTAAELGNAALATKPFQHNPDLLFGRMVFACGPADVLTVCLAVSRDSDLGLMFALRMDTMSQEPSSLQVMHSVPMELNPDSLAHDFLLCCRLAQDAKKKGRANEPDGHRRRRLRPTRPGNAGVVRAGR